MTGSGIESKDIILNKFNQFLIYLKSKLTRLVVTVSSVNVDHMGCIWCGAFCKLPSVLNGIQLGRTKFSN